MFCLKQLVSYGTWLLTSMRNPIECKPWSPCFSACFSWMCSWWDSNRASRSNPLIQHWTGIRDVLCDTGTHGKATWREEESPPTVGKGATRRRQKGRTSQHVLIFPFPAGNDAPMSNYPAHFLGTPRLAAHSLLPQRWPRRPATSLRASLHRAPGDTGIRAAERKWPWEMPTQSMLTPTKLWKPKVLFITHLIAKCDYTNVKLFIMFICPSYYDVFNYTVLAIHILSRHLLPSKV